MSVFKLLSILFQKSLYIAIIIVFIILPYSTWACAVCGSYGSDRSYLYGGALLLAVFFGIGGGLTWYIFKQYKKFESPQNKS